MTERRKAKDETEVEAPAVEPIPEASGALEVSADLFLQGTPQDGATVDALDGAVAPAPPEDEDASGTGGSPMDPPQPGADEDGFGGDAPEPMVEIVAPVTSVDEVVSQPFRGPSYSDLNPAG